LQQNLDGYVQWAKTHNSLLLIVGDSGDRQHNFALGTETIITGDPRLFVPGTDTNTVNHFNTLRTIEDMYGLAPLGSSATAMGLDTNAAGQLAAPGTQLGTTAALASSANPSVFGQAVTLTATIAPTASGPNTPSGVVTFKDGATTLGTGTLNASGVATFATTRLVRRVAFDHRRLRRRCEFHGQHVGRYQPGRQSSQHEHVGGFLR